MFDRRPITLDANDRILWEGHHGITFGNPEHYAYVTLHPSHEDFWVPVGGTIIP